MCLDDLCGLMHLLHEERTLPIVGTAFDRESPRQRLGWLFIPATPHVVPMLSLSSSYKSFRRGLKKIKVKIKIKKWTRRSLVVLVVHGLLAQFERLSIGGILVLEGLLAFQKQAPELGDGPKKVPPPSETASFVRSFVRCVLFLSSSGTSRS